MSAGCLPETMGPITERVFHILKFINIFLYPKLIYTILYIWVDVETLGIQGLPSTTKSYYHKMVLRVHTIYNERVCKS